MVSGGCSISQAVDACDRDSGSVKKSDKSLCEVLLVMYV
jgi:hypothetical protein